ncbi:MAG: LPS-assembly protein LptD [Paracoccaceae bacterium]
MRRLLPALLALFLALPALAQDIAPPDLATLIADRVELNGDESISASGSVEIFYKSMRLRADRITYDATSELLTIEGPITLEDGGGTVVLASAAELSRDFRDGIMQGARLILQQEMQVAANELRRIDGRFNVMTKVVASSCEVCPSNPRPLWEIRAREVVHDELGRQLYFSDAQLRVAGVPVFYLPRLRLPDPTVERATGFLAPTIRSTSALGFGIRVPFFIALGESRDLTVEPYFSTGSTRTLKLRYRQAFETGALEFTGALSRDTLLPGDTRGYLFGDGSFVLPRGFRLDFTVEETSDPAYLLDYGLSDADRLDTGLDISRTRADQYIRASLDHYNSIRSGDINPNLPNLVGDAVFEKRFAAPLAGGNAAIRFELHDQERASSVTADLDGDGFPDGRDLTRATVALDWRGSWTTGGGIVVSGLASGVADLYSVREDPVFSGAILRSTPTAAIELRWPWVRGGKGGVTQVIEPVAQLVWSPDSTEPVPNEDSVSVEFDEGNLFALNRFPGADAYEAGLRANLGVSYTRLDPAGWSLGITGGRVLRADDLRQFSTGTGLSGTSSDWLLATEYTGAGGFRVVNRALFDDGFAFTRDELRLGWQGARGDFSAGYIWQVPDPAENRLTSTSELRVDAGWQISDGWRGAVTARYDFTADRAARAGFGLEYRSECAAIDLSLSRRFTSSTSVDAVTDFRLGVSFSGFGAGANGRTVRRTCTG